MSRMALILAGLISLGASGQTWTMPVVIQSQSNWCWAACSQAVLTFYGVSKTQSQIASFATPNNANITNWLAGQTSNPTRKGIDLILAEFAPTTTSNQAFGVRSDPLLLRPLTMSEVVNQMSFAQPIVIGYAWAGGGGHAVVVHGVNQSAGTVAVMDPLDGALVISHSTLSASTIFGQWNQSLTSFRVPAAPNSLSGVAGVCAVKLTWTQPVPFGFFTDWVERRIPGGSWSVISGSSGGSSNVITTLSNQPCGATLEYRVRTQSNTGSPPSPVHFSSYTNTLSITTLAVPAAPTVSIANIDETLVLSWSAGYRTLVERQPEGGAWAQIADLPSWLSGSVDAAVPEFQRHRYRVRFRVDDALSQTFFSGYSNEESGTRFAAWLVPVIE